MLVGLGVLRFGQRAVALDALGVSLDSIRRQIALLLSLAPPPSEQSDEGADT